MRLMKKRPIGIDVSYLNEEAEEIEEKLYDFQARVFLHEMDHINGEIMKDWRLQDGRVDLIDDKDEE